MRVVDVDELVVLLVAFIVVIKSSGRLARQPKILRTNSIGRLARHPKVSCRKSIGRLARHPAILRTISVGRLGRHPNNYQIIIALL